MKGARSNVLGVSRRVPGDRGAEAFAPGLSLRVVTDPTVSPPKCHQPWLYIGGVRLWLSRVCARYAA
jgi:hypothetical protein